MITEDLVWMVVGLMVSIVVTLIVIHPWGNNHE